MYVEYHIVQMISRALIQKFDAPGLSRTFSPTALILTFEQLVLGRLVLGNGTESKDFVCHLLGLKNFINKVFYWSYVIENENVPTFKHARYL